MKKIIALTGSFNPVTRAHFEILSDAVEKFGADEGVFIATNDKYLTAKSLLKAKVPSNFILSEETRAEMLQSLSEENPKISFGGYEVGGIAPNTYASLVRLLKAKKKQYPREDIKLFFLFGADKLHGVPHWQHAEETIALCEYLVYARRLDMDAVLASDQFFTAHRDRIHLLQVENEDLEDVSSTEVRRRFFAGEDFSELMNEGPYRVMQRFSPADFSAVSPEDTVRAQYLYGGHYGKNAGRLQVYKNNSALFRAWAEPWLGDREAHRAAKVYRSAFSVSAPELLTPPEASCVNADCADVAEGLIRDGFHPAILNLASATSPCGGYHDGASAQEESISRMSTLSQSLYRFGDPKYKHIREAELPNTPGVYPLDLNFGGVYSPTVTFFRHGEEEFYAIREDKFDCPVITVASLSNREKNGYTNDQRRYFKADEYLTAEGCEIEKNKIRTIFRIALDNGHDSVVLGAFGCGVYRLRSDEVAGLFRAVLDEPEFRNRFRRLVFAIYEGKPSSRKAPMGREGKFAPFYEVFG
ncbi:MAG: TIGR02452 family protein [Clostridiales bacterium]|nr:TIGR02452 family protein [Candidatus Coliplasma caballi]